MAKRMVLMLLAVAAVVGGLGFVKYRQIKAASASAGYVPPPEAVTTVVAQEVEWDSTLHAIGSLVAVQGVDISTDLPGIVDRINFESGERVEKGRVLVHLDSRQEEAQLAAVEAERELARLTLERNRGLVKDGVVPPAELDRAVAGFDQAAARVGELRATLARKTIRAPFSGVVGIRRVNLGQFVASGDAMVSLQALDPVYVDFAVPQQDASRVAVGTAVELAIEGFDAAEARPAGKVSAVDALVDEATRNVRVRAEVGNGDGRLRPGMFVEVRVQLGEGTKVLPLPASAVIHAPYGDSVFVVEDVTGPDGKTYRGVRQQFVKVHGSRGDQVGVVSGLKPGEEIVSSGGFKLRNGAAVVVNNEVQPGNDPAPKGEDS